MAAVVDQPGPGSPPPHDTGTGRARWTRLQKRAIKVLVYVVFAYLLFRLLPALKQALRSLEHVRWPWILGAVAPELLSEFGYVQSWRGIVDPDRVLAADGGARTATRAVWAQLAGGLVMPGGSLTSIGIGAWILRRFGMPATTIAERQCNLSFLNTAASIGSVSAAVRATDRILFHRGSRRSLAGALAYLGFDALVLWTAFLAIYAHPLPGFAVVVMAYIIGALGASIPHSRLASGPSEESRGCWCSTALAVIRRSARCFSMRPLACSSRGAGGGLAYLLLMVA